MKFIIFTALLLLMAFVAVASADNVTGFDDYSLTVTVTANPDGTAHVDEEVQLIASPNVFDLYKNSLRSTRLTISDWQNTTGSKNLRYHILATPMNTRVFPHPLQPFTYVDKSVAIITVEYDTSAPVFNVTAAGPRKTLYAFNPQVLSFENAPEGQVLPENTVLVINILPNSKAENILPRPTSPADAAQGKPSTAISYMWNATGGAIPLTSSSSSFDFSFITEQSIDAEVSAYFASMQAQTKELLFSNYGLLLVILALIFISLFFILKQTKTI